MIFSIYFGNVSTLHLCFLTSGISCVLGIRTSHTGQLISNYVLGLELKWKKLSKQYITISQSRNSTNLSSLDVVAYPSIMLTLKIIPISVFLWLMLKISYMQHVKKYFKDIIISSFILISSTFRFLIVVFCVTMKLVYEKLKRSNFNLTIIHLLFRKLKNCVFDKSIISY